MSNFLIVLSENGNCADELFRSGLALTQVLKEQLPLHQIAGDWYRAATFARHNGTGGALALDHASGSWLVAAGIWFHVVGYTVGDEHRLLMRFLDVGVDRVSEEIDGCYTIVFGNGRTCQAYVMTGPAGSQHSFVRHHPGAVSLSGSSLVLAGLGEHSLDPISTQEFISTGTIYESRTAFKQVSKFGASSISVFERGRQTACRRYWLLSQLEPESIAKPDEAVERLWQSVKTIITAATQAYPHPVCDLTGGYDSRLLVSVLLESGIRFAATVAGEANSLDVRISKAVAEVAGIEHIFIPPDPVVSRADLRDAVRFTDGESDIVDNARILRVQKELSSSFDMSINGHTGEIGRGYGWDALIPRTGKYEPLDARKVARIRYAPAQLPQQLFPFSSLAHWLDHFTRIVANVAHEADGMPNVVQYDWVFVSLRSQRWQGRIASSTDQWWPCFTPFVCRTFLAAAMQTKTSMRRRSLTVRRLLSKYQPVIANLPLDHGYPAVPATPANWYKFIPMLAYYAPKGFARLSRMAGLRLATVQHPGATGTTLMTLWKLPEVATVLEARKMKLAEVFPIDGLSSFLDDSRKPSFMFQQQWNRLLSLESGLQTLAAAIRQIGKRADVGSA